MGIMLKLITLLLIFLTSGVISISNEIIREEVSFQTKQRQIYSLFNNLGCVRMQDMDLISTSASFHPLEHLDSYPNASLVSDFVHRLENGSLESRLEPFTNDPNDLEQMTAFFDILYSIPKDNWNLFYNTTAFFVLRMNTAQFFWGLSTILSTKYYESGLKSPTMMEIVPQFFADKRDVLEANGLENDDTDEDEDVLRYWKKDPELNSYHTSWHVDFPFWWKPEKYNLDKGRKGELFVYMHHQLLNRYKAELLSNGLPEVQPLIVDKITPIPEGDKATIVNVDLEPYLTRPPNSYLEDTSTNTVDSIMQEIMRINDSIQIGYFIDTSGAEVSIRNPVNGTQILGTVVESSEQSVNRAFYGSIHNIMHRIVAKIGTNDPTDGKPLPAGVLAHSEASLHDDVFYRLHLVIDNLLKKQKYYLEPYSTNDLGYPEINLNSVKIVQKSTNNNPSLLQNIGERLLGFFQKIGEKLNLSTWPFVSVPTIKTFTEPLTFDISNAVLKDCDAVNGGKSFTSRTKVLSHHPFDYEFTVHSNKLGNEHASIRIFMAPQNDADGKPYSNDQLHWNMIEMDKFPVIIKPGQNIIRRNSQNSSVTIGKLKGFKALYEELAANGNEEEASGSRRPFRLCGYPNRLLIPKGNVQGMRFKMFVIISPEDQNIWDEESYPSISLCANPVGSYPDKRAMGFPFDRRVHFGRNVQLPWIIKGNYRFIDLIVKHRH